MLNLVQVGAAWIYKNATITSLPSAAPTANSVSSQGSTLETSTIIIIVVVVGAALVAVLAYFCYRYHVNNKYATSNVAEMSQGNADSKNTRAPDIQIQDKEKNGDKFVVMTDIYGGNNDVQQR